MQIIKVNINLDKSTSKIATALYFSIVHNGKRFRFYTGYRILPKKWSTKKQMVIGTTTNIKLINSKLKSYIGEIHNVAIELKLQGIDITKITLLPRLQFLDNNQGKSKTTFAKYFDTFIQQRKNKIAIVSLNGMKPTLNTLQKFADAKKITLAFANINNNFYNEFRNYFITENNGFNATFGKHIKVLKTFLNWCYDEKIIFTKTWLKFDVLKEKKEVMFLTPTEIATMAALPLTGLLEQVRDFFLIECYTGLRNGDILKLTANNIKGGNIVITTQKTNTTLQIPIIDLLQPIINKYFTIGGKVPLLSNQVMNRYLKAIAEQAGINDTVIYSKYQNTTKVDFELKKYERVTTHTARHSFITNSLAKGIQPDTIRQIVGHSSLKTMAKYSQVNNINNTKEMQKWNKV